MADEKGAWRWMGRANTLTALLSALASAVLSTISYFSGVSHGEVKQRTETLQNIEKLNSALPETQRQRTAPVFEAMKIATSGAGSVPRSPEEISVLAQGISNAVTGLPTSSFSVGTSRSFAVPEQKTALVCGDSYHVGYGGRGGYHDGLYVITFETERWETTPGNTKRFENGVALTLMQVDAKLASLDIICQQPDQAKRP